MQALYMYEEVNRGLLTVLCRESRPKLHIVIHMGMLYFLHNQSWTQPWIKSTFKDFSCGPVSRVTIVEKLWWHQQSIATSPAERKQGERKTKSMCEDRHFLKGKHPLVGWCETGDHLLASGGGFLRLMPASDIPIRITRRAGVFLLYRTYLWNKQQVMSIDLTTWSTMQYHVVVDHVIFYVIHSQLRHNRHLWIRMSCKK